ncbi:MAG: hypothetical protein OXU68_00140, partial [Bacteroidota bacterium]|nr:hypothetical protein [Bacteroidota bacterium]
MTTRFAEIFLDYGYSVSNLGECYSATSQLAERSNPDRLSIWPPVEALAKRVNHGVLPISRFAGRATPQPPHADAPASEAV